MSTPVGAAAAGVHLGGRPGVKSRDAMSVAYALLDAPPTARRAVLRELGAKERTFVLAEVLRETGSAYGLWHDTPSGFVEDVLGESLWQAQVDVLEALRTHKRTAVPAGFGVGKCVHQDDVIPLADGRRVRAGDLVDQEFAVMAWREDGAQVRRAARAAWNAVEPVHRIRTVSGREVRRNAAHPLWAADAEVRDRAGRRVAAGYRGTRRLVPKVLGWTPAASIHPGQLILVPERHHAEGAVRVPEHHPRLLGYLLGDGGTSSPSQITFTQKDGPALDDFRALLAVEGCELVAMSKPYHYRVRSKVMRHRAPEGDADTFSVRWSPLNDLVTRWGLRGKTARTKTLPDWAWTLPNDQLAEVLGALLSCDGWVSLSKEANGRRSGHAAISLASEQLVRDVEAAMLRLGVWGNVRHRTMRLDGKEFDAWEWSCRDREALTQLRDAITIPGPKQERLVALVEALSARSDARRARWPRSNAPAGYRWDEVKEVEVLPEAQTVAIEVDEEHTFVTSLVEHNTHLAGRAVAWFCVTQPVGLRLAVTTATRFRQVKLQLWPHIRKAVGRAGLPGVCDQTQWKIPDPYGSEVVVAYGFTAPEGDEAAMQGIHSPDLMLIVDEAGGISKLIGEGTNNLLTGHARMLAIGNPPMDDPGSWFEGLCAEGESGDEPGTITIPIPSTASPAITGQPTPQCRDCPSTIPAHSLATHLPDQDWVDRTIRAYGEGHPYVTAKVHAKFPKDGGRGVLPTSWVESAADKDDPTGDQAVRLSELGLDGEYEDLVVNRRSWVRLGVDVAADGGDEFVIARSVGDLVHVRHASSGSDNSDPVKVAERVQEEIKAAERLAAALGSRAQVRVKVDIIGVGWGVVGMLERWQKLGRFQAAIVPVDVREAPEHDASDSPMIPNLKRDEMWLAMRGLIQPDPATGEGRVRLRVDRKTLAQLSTPTESTNSGGRTVVESKSSMRARGVKSPDRAEALLLSTYEPRPIAQRRRRGLLHG